MNSMRVLILLGTVLCLTVSSYGINIPKVHFGRCSKDIQVQQNFDAASYMGLWYEQAGYNTAWVEGGDPRCVAAEYGLNTSTGVVSVRNTAIDNKGNFKKGINGTAVLDDPSKKEGKLTVTFKIGVLDVKGMYWVLGTDYKTYAVVYACENFLFLDSYTVWFLGREQVFGSASAEEAFYNATNSVLRANNIDPSLMSRTTQTNCTAD